MPGMYRYYCFICSLQYKRTLVLNESKGQEIGEIVMCSEHIVSNMLQNIQGQAWLIVRLSLETRVRAYLESQVDLKIISPYSPICHSVPSAVLRARDECIMPFSQETIYGGIHKGSWESRLCGYQGSLSIWTSKKVPHAVLGNINIWMDWCGREVLARDETLPYGLWGLNGTDIEPEDNI